MLCSRYNKEEVMIENVKPEAGPRGRKKGSISKKISEWLDAENIPLEIYVKVLSKIRNKG